jgi:glycosyltransferase involved in cell wall biosynthesis
MLCGVPVVATDLPGVREPVRLTGMGEIVPARDARSLADAVTRVLRARSSYVRPRAKVAALFDIERTVDLYEGLFAGLLAKGNAGGEEPTAAVAR